MRKNVITIATGKKLYIDLAVNLYRSFTWWNKNSEIAFYLVTDREDLIPAKVKEHTNVITIATGELGEGFSSKLHLDHLAPEGQTLFIDSDCLVYGDLLPIFDRFKGHSVSVIGGHVSEGEWFGDIKKICRKYDVKHIPKFNGGVYYIEKGEIATKVYQTARELEKKYDEIGFTRLRNRPNDEVIMALAMQLHNQEPIKEDGTIMAEFVNFRSGIKSDVINGKVILLNLPSHKNYQPNWELTSARPLIVHFLGFYNKLYPYITEEKVLYYTLQKKYPPVFSKILSNLQITLPWQLLVVFKDTFRPLFRTLFGVRKVKKSERIVD